MSYGWRRAKTELWALSACFALPAQRDMSFIEDLELDPWTKWRDFGRLPLKLVFHITLLILITCQIFMINSTHAPFNRAMERNWIHLFYPEDYTRFQNGEDFMETQNGYYIFEIDKAVHDMQYVIDRYWSIAASAVDGIAVANEVLILVPPLAPQPVLILAPPHRGTSPTPWTTCRTRS